MATETTISMQPEKVKNQDSLLGECDVSLKETQTFLIWSIINNFCCFFTCGLTLCCSLPALVFSLNVKSAVKRNNKNATKRNSLLAFLFNITTGVSILAFFVSTLVLFIYAVYFTTMGVQWFCDLPLNWTC